MIADEADVGDLTNERAAFVRPRPVADGVAEAPHGIRRLGVDRSEHCLQRMGVTVDVGDDCDAHSRTPVRSRNATRRAGVWIVAAWLLWKTSVPSNLSIPDLSEDAFFTQSELEKANDYELFHRINWLLSTVVLFVVLGIYAVKGVRFMRESAAGRIGTGMLLAMLGFGLVWLVSVPFAVAGNWWDRRHGVSKIDYWELLFGGWLGLGAQFVFLSLSVLIVMGLARPRRRLVVDPRQPRLHRPGDALRLHLAVPRRPTPTRSRLAAGRRRAPAG